MPKPRTSGFAGLVAASVALVAVSAGARVESGSPYGKTQVFSAALRYLRVDLGYEVTEKDADAAYVLFRFSAAGRKTSSNGSIQIVERAEGVRLVVDLPNLPRYHEQMLADGLHKKLVTEYGEPPRKTPRPNDKGGKDREPGGNDDDKDGDKPKADEKSER